MNLDVKCSVWYRIELSKDQKAGIERMMKNKKPREEIEKKLLEFYEISINKRQLPNSIEEMSVNDNNGNATIEVEQDACVKFDNAEFDLRRDDYSVE